MEPPDPLDRFIQHHVKAGGSEVEGRRERYASEAEYEIRVAAAQLGGFLLIVTHAADPEQMTTDILMQAFASPVTLVGWAVGAPR